LAVEFFAPQEDYNAYERDIIQMQAQFRRLRREESRGTIDQEDAQVGINRITDNLLDLLEEFEEGPVEPTSRARKVRRLWPAGLILLVLGGLAYVWWINREPQTRAAANCPSWTPDADFNIMLLPFDSYESTADYYPHKSIATDLIRMSSQYELNTSIREYENEQIDAFTLQSREADRLARRCRAGLILWGTYGSQPPDGIVLSTHYKFLFDQPQLPELKYAEDMHIDTVRSVASIATEGLVVTQQIEQVLLILLGMVAHELGNSQAVISTLEKAADTEALNEQAALTRDLLLGSAYLSLDDRPKAIEAYSRVLNNDRNNLTALNNRAMLQYQGGNYNEAIRDISLKLEKTPQDPDALRLRGASYLKIEQFNKAQRDFSRVKQLKPSDRNIDLQLRETDKAIEKEKDVQSAADAQLSTDPDNLNALVNKAQSSYRLDDHRQAISAARKILTKDPDNAKAYTILVDAYRETGNAEMIRRLLSRASEAGLDTNAILRKNIIFQPIRPNLQIEQFNN
ncbi:MAG: tetratricopeptide repeat protein, partial [Saprospiraceae bacterium]|nr:tetratricopeptide repeat protein [Saprospiraceae bacterium]